MITVVSVCQSHKKQREKAEKKRTKGVGEKKQKGEKLGIRERQERRGERKRERERAIIPTAGVLHATADFCRQRILKHKMILYDMLYGVLGSFYLLLSTFYLTFYTPKRRKAECF